MLRVAGNRQLAVVKKLYSILLVSVLLSGLFRDGVTIMMFKLNQAYIASTLCVNRDKPMTMCGGSCYLKKKLEENHREDDPFPASRTNEDRLLEFYSCAMLSVRPKACTQDQEQFHVYDEMLRSDDVVAGIFHPPKI